MQKKIIKTVFTPKQALIFLVKVWALTIILGYCVIYTISSAITAYTDTEKLRSLLSLVYPTIVFITLYDAVLLTYYVNEINKSLENGQENDKE